MQQTLIPLQTLSLAVAGHIILPILTLPALIHILIIQGDVYSMEVVMLTYKVAIWCYNCGAKQEVEIPKGTTVEEFSRGFICPVCGCSISPECNSDPHYYQWGGETATPEWEAQTVTPDEPTGTI